LVNQINAKEKEIQALHKEIDDEKRGRRLQEALIEQHKRDMEFHKKEHDRVYTEYQDYKSKGVKQEKADLKESLEKQLRVKVEEQKQRQEELKQKEREKKELENQLALARKQHEEQRKLKEEEQLKTEALNKQVASKE